MVANFPHGTLAHKVGAYLFVDAVHYAPHFALDADLLDADFLVCSPHKFYGPHLGFLVTRQGLLDQLLPEPLVAVPTATPLEIGTLSHQSIVGLAATVEYLASWGEGGTLRQRIVSAISSIGDYEHQLAKRLWQELQTLPGLRLWGPDFSSPRRTPTLAFTLKGYSPHQVAHALAQRGLQAWDGHCFAPRAVTALGRNPDQGFVRVGISMYNLESEIDRLIDTLRPLAMGR